MLALSVFTGGMQGLAHLGWARPLAIAACLLLVTVSARWLASRTPPLVEGTSALAMFAERSSFCIWLVFGGGLGLALLSAYWLPIWQWDALGYHLPFVNFVLQAGGLRGLPDDVPYLSTYPRNVELLFVGLRSFLPDDRLVDLAQIPFGLIGCIAIAGIARELGARRPDATVAGMLWLLVPAVFLQLPTNYIDVATGAYFLLAAYFLVAHPTRAALLCAGLAIGLFLGTKPSAPPAAALLALMLLMRGHRAGDFRGALFATLLAGALGLEAYAMNVARHTNPVWPAIVDIGPVHLPGTIRVTELLSSGAGAEKVHGPLFVRLLKSWTTISSLPAFDMRVGGLSILFWLTLPLALYRVVTRKRFVLAALLAAAMVTPDPAVARYVLPVPGLVFAAALPAIGDMSRVMRTLLHLALAFCGAGNIVYAAPGLTGEGPSLLDYRKMSWRERELAVGANGTPKPIVEARNRLTRGDTAVYDRSLWLPYSMWRSDLANRVVRVPDGATPEQARRILRGSRVRLIAAGTGSALERAVELEQARLELLFRCKEPCAVYWRH